MCTYIYISVYNYINIDKAYSKAIKHRPAYTTPSAERAIEPADVLLHDEAQPGRNALFSESLLALRVLDFVI